MSSLIFKNVYINDTASIVGPYEKKGELSFRNSLNDFYYNEKTFEDAEIKMQRSVLENLLFQNNLTPQEIDLVVGGDLMNQLSATSYNLRDFRIPFLGVYSACASFPESLIVASNMLETRFLKKAIAITSSHNLTSEKQFRFQ